MGTARMQFPLEQICMNLATEWLPAPFRGFPYGNAGGVHVAHSVNVSGELGEDIALHIHGITEVIGGGETKKVTSSVQAKYGRLYAVIWCQDEKTGKQKPGALLALMKTRELPS